MANFKITKNPSATWFLQSWWTDYGKNEEGEDQNSSSTNFTAKVKNLTSSAKTLTGVKFSFLVCNSGGYRYEVSAPGGTELRIAKGKGCKMRCRIVYSDGSYCESSNVSIPDASPNINGNLVYSNSGGYYYYKDPYNIWFTPRPGPEYTFYFNEPKSIPGNGEATLYFFASNWGSGSGQNCIQVHSSYDYLEEAEAASYTITYNANGGSGAPASQTKIQGVTATLTTSKPVAPTRKITFDEDGGGTVSDQTVNRVFKEWNTKSDGTGTSYASGGTYSGDSNLTLYAIWGDPKVPSLPTTSRPNCVFQGWYSTIHTGGSKLSEGSTLVGSITVYARWKYKVSFSAGLGGSFIKDEVIDDDGNIVDVSRQPPDLYVAYNESFTLPGEVCEKNGYVQTGWGTGNSLGYDKAQVTSPKTFTASYTERTYKIIYDLKGGVKSSSDTGPLIVSGLKHGSTHTLKDTPTKSNCTFKGWSVNGTLLVAGSSITITEDITVVATWDRCPIWKCKRSESQWFALTSDEWKG